MSDTVVPHFQNDIGAETIRIGSKRFLCIGATPPFDHPHEFLDMGDDDEKVCPYCSTLYRFDPSLDPHASMPGACLWEPLAA